MMRDGNYFIQAPLLLGGEVSQAEIFGAAVWLWMHSVRHRDAPLYVLPAVLLPIVKRQQYVLVSEGTRPVFFLSWMWLNPQSEQHYLTDSVLSITEEEWCSGNRMWFRDFIAPFGHTRAMSRLLRRVIMPETCARYLWHRGLAHGGKIRAFRGDQVSLADFRAWQAATAPDLTNNNQK
ncbi:toxin-activating lysine-acyltransferase [Enterobacteriaceae bacterium ESL0689]|nr:toxin-activating lysine-acyltransferase [Enterobacteriaceae bacterium ESL0689]